jgi:hypothetical protein
VSEVIFKYVRLVSSSFLFIEIGFFSEFYNETKTLFRVENKGQIQNRVNMLQRQIVILVIYLSGPQQ